MDKIKSMIFDEYNKRGLDKTGKKLLIYIREI
jgi:hypothetical protein